MSNEITPDQRSEIREWNRKIDARLADGGDIGGWRAAALAMRTAFVLDALEAAERERDSARADAARLREALVAALDCVDSAVEYGPDEDGANRALLAKIHAALAASESDAPAPITIASVDAPADGEVGESEVR